MLKSMEFQKNTYFTNRNDNMNSVTFRRNFVIFKFEHDGVEIFKMKGVG